MKTIIKKFNIYQYSELSPEAKEKVRQWYVDDPLRSNDLTEIFQEDLKNLFPNSELEVEWSLSYCQGDGVNVYGKLDFGDLIDMVQNNLCGDTYLEFKDFFSQKEMGTLKFYSDFCGDIKLPSNRCYTYCYIDMIDMEADWAFKLANNYFRNINLDLIEKAQKYVIDIFKKYCKYLEDAGYKYFDPDELYEGDMEDVCDSNNWYFMEDGTFYAA